MAILLLSRKPNLAYDKWRREGAVQEGEGMARKAKPEADPGSSAGERKRRTREHMIADLSVNHLERLVLRCGYTVQRVSADYGFDLWLVTYQETGEIEDHLVGLQLKASDNLGQYELTQEEVFSFPISTRDFRLWSGSLLPVFFILYDAQLDEAYWLDVQEYAATQQHDLSGKTIRLYIPRHHVLGVQTIRRMRWRKQQRLQELHAHMWRGN